MQDLRRKKGKKKKRAKKEKKLIAAKSGLVGLIGYFKKYNRVTVNIFYRKPFLNETSFYVKLSERFSGPKTKVR